MRSQHDELVQQLQERIAQLEQENAALQAELVRSHTQPEQLQNRDRASTDLTVRLLEATVNAVNTLLTLKPFDKAINTALQIIGESLESDRVRVIEHFGNPLDLSSYWRVSYKWDSPDTVSKISHPDVAQANYQGIEEWYKRLSQGQGISYLLEEIPEPLRSGQAKLGAKALHVVPIFVKSRYRGAIWIDDCRQAQRRSPAELAVMRIAADCIGSVIQRNRIQCVYEAGRRRILAEVAARQQIKEVEERNRMAREIHDTLAQTFTGISIQVNNAQHLADQEPEIAWSIIEQVKDLAHTGLAEARRSVWALHPEAEAYQNLVGSLQQELQQITTAASLRTDLSIHGNPRRVLPEIGMNLLRIVQEAIANTLRHAQAQTLLLELTFEPESLALRIQDDGQGFDYQLDFDKGGFGLLGMQQRCDRLGGQFTLLSQPGCGRTILIQVPLG